MLHHKQKSIPAGFRPAPKSRQKPISQMSLRELRDLHNLNTRILSSPEASTSTYMNRVSLEQKAIVSRLIELDGMEEINTRLKNTRLDSEADMAIDSPSVLPYSRTLDAKRKALSRFVPESETAAPGRLSMQEAIDLERQAFLQDKERQQRIAEKKRRLGMPIEGEVLSKEEKEARIWAFMNYKPTDSDMEEDDDSDDDDDPASWFEDDQDDGRKGQDIVEPDDLSDIIRVDPSRIHYSTFYQPRDEGS